jgi:ubiquinone/menaquinone biosynthesis C-methylase UbiE|tara:strand:+ start:233 stop:811 length:579 start_codon:yes stop_codon:yes gene_type:complete
MESYNWWQENLNLDVNKGQFKKWLEESDFSSRQKTFDLILQKSVKSVLEIGPGTFIDYKHFYKNYANVEYQAIDFTQKVVDYGKTLGVECKIGSIEDIPCEDNSFDFVYCRHVLEHLSDYKKAIEEMIRVSKNYVCLVFWMMEDKKPNLNFDGLLHHNSYVQSEVEDFVRSKNKNVKFFQVDNDKIIFAENL